MPTPSRGWPPKASGPGSATDASIRTGWSPAGRPQRAYRDAWASFERLFLLDDLTLINLECAPTLLGTPVPKNFNFRCPAEALGPTHAAGVDVASLANNHSGDFGLAAMLDANTNVAASGIQPVVSGVNLAGATAPVVIERNGWTIAVLGFNAKQYNPEWFAGPSSPGMAPGDIETMVAAVHAADETADLVFVTIHWGFEGTFTPAPADVERAEALIGAGADAIFGHHPHRLQPLSFIDGRPVFWSLGNFVWQSVASSRATAVAWVDVRTDGTFLAGFFPADIASKGVPVLTG